MNTQTTPNGNIISKITWNHSYGRQEGIATLANGETLKVWRGGYEPWGQGWLPSSEEDANKVRK
jgi:hypothetical protein